MSNKNNDLLGNLGKREIVKPTKFTVSSPLKNYKMPTTQINPIIAEYEGQIFKITYNEEKKLYEVVRINK